MKPVISFGSIDFKKSFFKPGEQVNWELTVVSEVIVEIEVVTNITYLSEIMFEERHIESLTPGVNTIQNFWLPPSIVPRGYGLDCHLESGQGEVLASYSTGFDVLEHWTQHPRYGFLTDFSPERESEKALDSLLEYRINGLQFYDWMYRHEQYLSDVDPYIDPLGREISFETVAKLIVAAHQRNMAAMPYTAVYAASIPFYENHKDWALYQADGSPHYFGEDFLVIMDPRFDSPWTEHLLDQFTNILAKTNFDGIHLDQYGAPKRGYDDEGNAFSLDQPLADLIDATHTIVAQNLGEEGSVIFNAVTNWPIETVAPSEQNVVYIEVWPPYTSFNDLANLVVQAQELGHGKPVIIAAYIDPFYETNVLLNDAIIFASGAGHIELGENGGYLADPYFPNYAIPSHQLTEKLQHYYAFSIRYQNVIGPQSKSVTKDFGPYLHITGVNTSPGLLYDKVMPIIRESEGYLAINLINLLGLPAGEWETGMIEKPISIDTAELELQGLKRDVQAVWFATPDDDDISLTPIDFTLDAGVLQLIVPRLDCWGLVLLQWSE